MAKANKEQDTTNLVKKLVNARDLLDECLDELTSIKLSAREKAPVKPKNKVEASENHIVDICNKIKECEESESIEKQVLDKRGIDNRVLLPYFICHKYFPNPRLTTGEIEKITGQMGVKIKTPNVSKAIADRLWKYLENTSTRARGKATLYKLNRKGATYFNGVLKSSDEK